MGEIGKHIEGQLRAGAVGHIDGGSTTADESLEGSSERGKFSIHVTHQNIISFNSSLRKILFFFTEAGSAAKDGPTPNTPGGGATALFPCLVYYPSNNNYSLIWVPMDGSNPAISQAAAAAGASSFQLPSQPPQVQTIAENVS